MNKKVIGLGRCKGKTTALLQKANREGYILIVSDIGRKKLLITKSKELGYKNVLIFTIKEIMLKRHYGYDNKGFLIDEIEDCFFEITNISPKFFSTSYELGGIKPVTNLEIV